MCAYNLFKQSIIIKNYAYKVVYPSEYNRKNHINYIWGLNFLVFEEINNKTQNWSNSSRAGGWTYKKKKKKILLNNIYHLHEEKNNYLLYFLLITKSFIELPPSSIYWLLKKLSTTNFQKKCLRNETRPQNFRHFLTKKESSLHYLESYTHVLKNLRKKKKTKFQQQQQIVMILKDIFKSNTKLVSRHHQHHHHINYN